MAAVGVKTI